MSRRVSPGLLYVMLWRGRVGTVDWGEESMYLFWQKKESPES